MFTKTNIIIGALLIGVLILGYIVIYRKSDTVVELFDDTELRDSIKIAQQNAVYWEDYAHGVERERDLIKEQKQKVRYVYKPQYIYINNTANIDQLDSVIRTNW